MAEIKLSLDKREVAGKKLAAVRAAGIIPAVIYGGDAEPWGCTESGYFPSRSDELGGIP